MFFLLGGSDKKARKQSESAPDSMGERVRNLFLNGKLPIVTTPSIEGKDISKVLGLVCCRGYDSDEAFFGMAARAVGKGAHAIVGYMENVAFHPDGSKYFSCFGTAVMFNYASEERFGAAVFLQRAEDSLDSAKPTPSEDGIKDTVNLTQASAGRTRNSPQQNIERRELLSQTRLGLDPDDVAPRKKNTKPAQMPQDDAMMYINPEDLKDDAPIRKFRTQ